jgi:hypothetical protein
MPAVEIISIWSATRREVSRYLLTFCNGSSEEIALARAQPESLPCSKKLVSQPKNGTGETGKQSSAFYFSPWRASPSCSNTHMLLLVFQRAKRDTIMLHRQQARGQNVGRVEGTCR